MYLYNSSLRSVLPFPVGEDEGEVLPAARCVGGKEGLMVRPRCHFHASLTFSASIEPGMAVNDYSGNVMAG